MVQVINLEEEQWPPPKYQVIEPVYEGVTVLDQGDMVGVPHKLWAEIMSAILKEDPVYHAEIRERLPDGVQLFKLATHEDYEAWVQGNDAGPAVCRTCNGTNVHVVSITPYDEQPCPDCGGKEVP